MKSLQSHSTHWRATCSYPTHGVDFRDYVRGNFKDFNIVDYIALYLLATFQAEGQEKFVVELIGNDKCKKVEYINIRGHIGIHQTVLFWQGAKSYVVHTDSSATTCQFKPKSGSVRNEDNFGYYADRNPKFRCTQDSHSTTQWWLGAHL